MNNNKFMNQNRYSDDIEMTLDSITDSLKTNEAVILEIEKNDEGQSDEIYDKLIMRGFHVKKSYEKGKYKIITAGKISNM